MKKLKQTHIIALGTWMRSHRKITYVGSCVLVLAVASVVSYALLHLTPSKVVVHTSAKKVVTQPPKKYYAPLTGIEVSTEADTKKLVTAVMIENSPDARPQSGLKDAETVYEAIAEGGITRFLVLYQQNKPSLIGPVRSVRPYYLDWTVPYNPSIAHVGGSAKALKEVRNGKYRDIDQFFNPNSYYRATDRYAPHNVYTTFKLLDALNAAKKYTSSTVQPLERADEAPAAKPTATSINVEISSPLFNSSYAYDAKTNSYTRSQGGEPHLDREKGAITPKVVVVLKVKESTVIEDTARQQIQTTGSGEATIFQNGTAQKVTWQRSSRDTNYTFKDASNKSVPLVRGQTWITAIPSDQGSVTWK